MTSATPLEASAQASSLGAEHGAAFRKALMNALSIKNAEFTYAQILDGLPTVESYGESYPRLVGHPVLELDHQTLCEGYLDQARHHRANLDPGVLEFKQSTLAAFGRTAPDTEEFNLRLIELVVVACHQIAAYLYELDGGAHKHRLYQDWLLQELPKRKDGCHSSGYVLPPCAFFHSLYSYPEQYPRGFADVAGYWAEGKIFGGVVVFDRGETEQECKSMWMHDGRFGGPDTLYPPTREQFDALVRFLRAEPEDAAPCPLPIHATLEHRPRWDAYEALSKYHIFRDKYERKLPPENPRSRHRRIPNDWPEYLDESFLLLQSVNKKEGREVDLEGIDAAYARLRQVTPSSPCWRPGWTDAEDFDPKADMSWWD